MIEPNALCQDEQDWLRTEPDQQNWLRAEQDQQDCLRAEQEIPLHSSDRGVRLHTAHLHYRNAGGALHPKSTSVWRTRSTTWKSTGWYLP
jgi:hypothetical protein